MAEPDSSTPAATTPEWEQWRRDMFGDPYLVMHDGPDFAALLGAARSNAQSVTRMLAAGISAGDSVAAESVTALTSAGLAPVQLQAPLATAIATASGTLRVCLAQALYALTADPAWADPIASVLATAAHWGHRIDAAIALATFAPTPTLIQALSQAVCDAEYLVRYHAANTLLRYAGLPGTIVDHRKLFKKIREPRAGRPASAADRSAWRDAADQLSAAALP